MMATAQILEFVGPLRVGVYNLRGFEAGYSLKKHPEPSAGRAVAADYPRPLPPGRQRMGVAKTASLGAPAAKKPLSGIVGSRGS